MKEAKDENCCAESDHIPRNCSSNFRVSNAPSHSLKADVTTLSVGAGSLASSTLNAALQHCSSTESRHRSLVIRNSALLVRAVGQASSSDARLSNATPRVGQPMNSPSQLHRTPAHHSHSNSLTGPSNHSHTIAFSDVSDSDNDAKAPLLIKSPTSPMPASSPSTSASSSLSSSSTIIPLPPTSSGSTLPSTATTTGPPPSWFRRRIVLPLFDILKSGATPEGIALSLAFGLTGGVFPVPAITTVACIVLAYVFSLNFPAVQLTNLLMTPVNLATFIPFIRAGEWLLGVDGVELTGVVGMLRSDPLGAVSVFWLSLARGVLAWLAFLPVATWLAYMVLRPIIRRVMGNMKFT